MAEIVTNIGRYRPGRRQTPPQPQRPQVDDDDDEELEMEDIVPVVVDPWVPPAAEPAEPQQEPIQPAPQPGPPNPPPLPSNPFLLSAMQLDLESNIYYESVL